MMDDLFEPGRTCWKVEQASRASFLVDGEEYFRTLADTISRAEHSVLIVGWDMDSRVRLWRGDAADRGAPAELCSFLNETVRSRGIHAYVLNWDWSMVYALERELLPIFHFGWKTHRRLHFRLDDHCPTGGSHHQKIVVVDDRVAFCGGLDLTRCRWDTRAHEAGDPRRIDPLGNAYNPFHDVQMMVEGDAAARLGDLLRTRWHRATGRRLAKPEVSGSPWPPDCVADLENVEVAIARTEPAFAGEREIREVEALHLEVIRQARSSIYIENQYLTSRRIAAALLERLREADGPEIIIVTQQRCTGWLEEAAMGTLRAQLVRELRANDPHGHLAVLAPVSQELGDELLNVHAKLVVADGCFARVGSANLSNRSMGLDTECDLAVVASTEEHRRGVERFRDGLLAEHLGSTPEVVAARIRSEGSVLRAIESLQGNDRDLVPLEISDGAWLELPEAHPLDPERPFDLDALVDTAVGDLPIAPGPSAPTGTMLDRHPATLRLGIASLTAVLAAVVWFSTPLRDMDPDLLTATVEGLRDRPWAAVAVPPIFLVGGLLLIPVNLLILVTLAVFGSVQGFALALIGGVVAAAGGLLVGRALGRDFVRELAGKRLNAVSRLLRRSGLVPLVALRSLPVAPFAVVNIVAGATHLPIGRFLLATAIGLAPGTLALAVFRDGLFRALQQPGPLGLAYLGLVVAAALILVHWARKLIAAAADR